MKKIGIFLILLMVLIAGAITRLAEDWGGTAADDNEGTVTVTEQITIAPPGTTVTGTYTAYTAYTDSTSANNTSSTAANSNVGYDITDRFPDEHFRSAIRETLSLPENAPINSGDVAAVKSLSLSGKSIKDLTGIEYFLSLEELDISDNMLTFLPRLPDTITEFNCDGNPDLDLETVYFQNGDRVLDR